MKQITVKRITELGDTVQTTITVCPDKGVVAEAIVISGPPELIEFSRNSNGGREWYRPADTKAKRRLWV